MTFNLSGFFQTCISMINAVFGLWKSIHLSGYGTVYTLLIILIILETLIPFLIWKASKGDD